MVYPLLQILLKVPQFRYCHTPTPSSLQLDAILPILYSCNTYIAFVGIILNTNPVSSDFSKKVEERRTVNSRERAGEDDRGRELKRVGEVTAAVAAAATSKLVLELESNSRAAAAGKSLNPHSKELSSSFVARGFLSGISLSPPLATTMKRGRVKAGGVGVGDDARDGETLRLRNPPFTGSCVVLLQPSSLTFWIHVSRTSLIKWYILQPPRKTEEGAVNEKVTVLLHDGTEIKDIDVVILPHPEFVHVLPVHVDDVSGTATPTQIQPFPSQLGVNGTPTPPQSSAVSIMSYINPVLPQTPFINAVLAIPSFIISDVASAWLALAWSGEVKYPEKVEERLTFDWERSRRNRKMLQLVKNSLAPEPPSSFMTYGFLGGGSSSSSSSNNNEKGEGADIVKARKKLDELLPVWDEEMIQATWEMFPTKYEPLNWAQMPCV
ncbi:hypothetical protein GYMLUDRAFT_239285 [Collybiopsis luxurians FD-317 M1]|nr:hypothetical protein GYMLUDRAFT_239285 [Collybiopsis luxurians FD-317 M1]